MRASHVDRIPLKKVPCFLVLFLFMSACGGSHPRYTPPQPESRRAALVRLGQALEGLPYRWGGGDIDGFDCSGLVYYVYDCFGYALPRKAAEMAESLTLSPVTRPPQGGDVLLFRIEGAWHAGLALDGTSFLHAPKKGDPVRREILNRFWRSLLKGLIEPPAT